MIDDVRCVKFRSEERDEMEPRTQKETKLFCGLGAGILAYCFRPKFTVTVMFTGTATQFR